MLEALIVIFFIWLMFKFTVFLFRTAGKVLGFLLGLTGYLILGILAITVFGLALYALPAVLLSGILAVALADIR